MKSWLFFVYLVFICPRCRFEAAECLRLAVGESLPESPSLMLQVGRDTGQAAVVPAERHVSGHGLG